MAFLLFWRVVLSKEVVILLKTYLNFLKIWMTTDTNIILILIIGNSIVYEDKHSEANANISFRRVQHCWLIMRRSIVADKYANEDEHESLTASMIRSTKRRYLTWITLLFIFIIIASIVIYLPIKLNPFQYHSQYTNSVSNSFCPNYVYFRVIHCVNYWNFFSKKSLEDFRRTNIKFA